MQGKNTFSWLPHYHRWAYGRLYERIDELNDSDYFGDSGLFFRSVHGSLSHLLLVERLWLDRLNGIPTGKVNLAQELESRRDALREAIFRQCENFIAWVDAFDARRLEEELRFTNSQGQPMQLPFAPLIAHIVNHGSHHRGQISTLLTQRGIEAPVMDIPYFLADWR